MQMRKSPQWRRAVAGTGGAVAVLTLLCGSSGRTSSDTYASRRCEQSLELVQLEVVKSPVPRV